MVVVLCSSMLGAASLSPDNPDREWYFKVYLDGKEVGFHSFKLRQNEFTQTLDSIASFDVKILFFNAFRYRHENVEVWQGQCLRSIESKTKNGKEDFAVSGRLVEDGFLVNSNQNESRLPQCVSSFAYWQPQALRTNKLLNGQTGDYEDVRFSEEGADKFAIVGKANAVDATRYRLSTGLGDIQIWYARKDGAWVGLESKVAGKRTLGYELSDAL